MDIPNKVYVVQRLLSKDPASWREGSRYIPVKAFVHRKAAEQHCWEHFNRTRERFFHTPPKGHCIRHNKRTFGELRDFTSLPPDEFITQIRSFGLTDFPSYPMNDGRSAYACRDCYVEFWNLRWWSTARKTLSAERFEDLWSLFDRLGFYQIAEVDTYSLPLSASEDDSDNSWCDWWELQNPVESDIR